MKTKEEILSQNGFDWESFKMENEYSFKNLLKSMDDYTNQVEYYKFEDLINQYVKEEMPDANTPFHHEAESAAGFKFFLQWLKNKTEVDERKTKNTEDPRFIKSFIVIKDVLSTKVGDIITIRKNQSQVPMSFRDLYFENEKNNHTFSFDWLLDNINEHVMVHEKFDTLKQKVKYFEQNKNKSLSCPVCKSENIIDISPIKEIYSPHVSGTFKHKVIDARKCNDCGVLFQPV